MFYCITNSLKTIYSRLPALHILPSDCLLKIMLQIIIWPGRTKDYLPVGLRKIHHIFDHEQYISDDVIINETEGPFQCICHNLDSLLNLPPHFFFHTWQMWNDDPASQILSSIKPNNGMIFWKLSGFITEERKQSYFQILYHAYGRRSESIIQPSYWNSEFYC